MDIISYKLAQQYANNVAAGFSRVEVNGTKINFTLNDGKTATVTVPTPTDGASITNVSINSSKHLICTLSSGSTIDAGEVPNIKGEKGDTGAQGPKGDGPTTAQIDASVAAYLEENPISRGATEEEHNQIYENKDNIEEVNENLSGLDSRLSESIAEIDRWLKGDGLPDFDKGISDFQEGKYYGISNQKVTEFTGGGRYAMFDVSQYMNKVCTITYDSIYKGSGRRSGLCDADGNVTYSYTENSVTADESGKLRRTFGVTSPRLFVSFSTSASDASAPKMITIHIDGEEGANKPFASTQRVDGIEERVDNVEASVNEIVSGDFDDKIEYFKFKNGSIHGNSGKEVGAFISNSPTPNSTGFSPDCEFENGEDVEVYFDTTKYKAMVVFYDADGKTKDGAYQAWITTSPITKEEYTGSLIVPKTWVLSLRTLDNSAIDWRTVDNAAWVIHRKNIASKTYVDSAIQNVMSEVDEKTKDVFKREEIIDLGLVDGKYISPQWTGYNWKNYIHDNSGSVYTPNAVKLDKMLLGKKLRIRVRSYGASSGRFFGFCDANDVVVKQYREGDNMWTQDTDGTYYVDVPVLTTCFFFSISKSAGFISATASYNLLDDLISCGGLTAYVAPDGKDNDDGMSIGSPFATINKALEIGATRIMLRGGKYVQTVDLSKANGKSIAIECYDRDIRPKFYAPDCFVATSATNVSGYTKIKTANVSQTFATGQTWIFQDSVNDETTLIDNATRHPSQRGKIYRCDDTKIKKCYSTSLEEALREIENASVYKWYLDSTNSKIYFSCPTDVTEEHPICCGFSNTTFFKNANRSMTLKLSGIECKYMPINVNMLSNAVVAECKDANAYSAGAFMYDNCMNATFIRCEAESCSRDGNGDGFNGHASGSANDPFAKCITCTLFDCWSHDNNDDGYSDHERSEITIIGGLYEYNKKGGITPSYGSHCSCFNVYSRHNFSGFLCCGDVAETEGGIGTQMICYGCVAENNTHGGMFTGFRVNGTGNSMILVDCRSIRNGRGYGADAGTFGKLIDCRAVGNNILIDDVGNGLTTENTELVTI